MSLPEGLRTQPEGQETKCVSCGEREGNATRLVLKKRRSDIGTIQKEHFSVIECYWCRGRVCQKCVEEGIECMTCGGWFCMTCSLHHGEFAQCCKQFECNKPGCRTLIECEDCGDPGCKTCYKRCASCEEYFCVDCFAGGVCRECDASICGDCAAEHGTCLVHG